MVVITSVKEEEVRRSTWVDLPQELQVNILVRIEKDNRRWPSRQAVVACAGVCKDWRATIR